MSEGHCGISHNGPFFDHQAFFKNRGSTFDTSDSDFVDLLDELFHITEKNFRKKIKMAEFVENKLIYTKIRLYENNKRSRLK